MAVVPITTLELPWAAPKFVPSTVTNVPAEPALGARAVMVTPLVVETVKLTELAGWPLTSKATG